MVDVERLRGVAAEFARLQRPGEVSPQLRGQRFNGVVAKVLRCWGIQAETSVRTTGEIDIAFAVDGVRYVMEAKWEAKRTDTGHIAKLQKRVRQRLLGTYGIFLSMSGYSKPALSDVTDGERLEVLLLDSEHFAAMLTGEVSPHRLLSLVHDGAAFYGRVFTPMAELRPVIALKPPSESPNSPPSAHTSADHMPTEDISPSVGDYNAAEAFVFSGRRIVNWVITCLLGLFTALTAPLVFIPPELTVGKLCGAVLVIMAAGLAFGFAQMARHPVRLIIGPRGIQLITWQYGTTWLPWDKIQSIEIANIYGGPHILAVTPDFDQYPRLSESVGIRPRYLPARGAVSLCPMNVLRATPWEVSHALHSYAGHRMKSESPGPDRHD